MQKLIEQFKNRRKRKYITAKTNETYAFIGMGNHSINNLYPIINYFRLNLKYIVTKSSINAELIDENFPNSIGTNVLEKVLDDDDVSGVFISTNPSSHYELVKKVLEADKNVFVEKPPCTNIEELKNLIRLEKSSKGQCLVGFQKRYAPLNKHLKNNLHKASYNYRFVTGNYPEGDAVLDLFIHPLSLVTFYFGPVESLNITQRKVKSAVTIFLQLVHENGAIGNLELSTAYSWQNATETIVINTKDSIYEITDFERLTLIPKTGNIFNIPKEKIYNLPNKLIMLENRNNFNPILQNNQLYSSGYFSEIESFVQICELGKATNHSTLSSCIDIFKLINKIKEHVDV